MLFSRHQRYPMLYSCIEGRTGGYAGVSAREKPLQVVRYRRISMED